MALNLKNAEVERLVVEVIAITGESKTEAVRQALKERKRRLAVRQSGESRIIRLKLFLEEELWPTVPNDQLGRAYTKEEEEALLGYGENGV